MRKVLARFNFSCTLIGNRPQSARHHTIIRYRQVYKKENQTIHDLKTEKKTIKKQKKSTHKTALPAKKRTNQTHKSLFARRAVAYPTCEQKLVSLVF